MQEGANALGWVSRIVSWIAPGDWIQAFSAGPKTFGLCPSDGSGTPVLFHFL